MTPHAALIRLGTLTEELQQAHRELASLLAAEKQARTEAWVNSSETTIAARDRTSDFNALHLTIEVLKLRGEIAALDTERSYLEIVVKFGGQHFG